MFDLKKFELWENVLIISSILIGVLIIFGIIVPLLKQRINKNSTIYLYSFSTGFFLVLALFGLLRESFTDLSTSSSLPKGAIGSLITIVIITIGSAIGVFVGLLSRFLLNKKGHEIHISHADHQHSDVIFNSSDIDNPKSKWITIYLLLTHRIVAGLTLGILVYQATYNSNAFSLSLILAFIFHIIPEILIIYYRQIEIGVSKWKAIFNSICFKLLMIPLIFIGAYTSFGLLDKAFWLIPLLLAISAGAIFFTSIFELIPEFLDNKDNTKLRWYKVSTILISGFLFAVIILLIHS